MARQERPIDPGAGPLQAFAWALRKLRVEAGGLTYRNMARTAGYSASTLSEAANGLRRPSLDVVLAYVGACGGDVDDWRQRWLELDAELNGLETTQPAQPDADGVPDTPLRSAETGVPPEAAPSGTEAVPADMPVRRRRWLSARLVAPLAVLAVLAVLGTAGVALTGHHSTPEHRAAAGCPAMPKSAAFTGRTYGSGVHVRTGASRDDPVLFTIPPGCVVGFTGYCLGEQIDDMTSNTPDVRWLRLPGGGVVASALVHGNAPASLAPSPCGHALPQPQSIALRVTADPRMPSTLRLRATGTYVGIVGFTAFYAGDPASPGDRRWQQIALTGEAKPTFSVPWRLDELRNRPGPNDELLVAAVACLGGEGSTDVMDVRAVRADGTSRIVTTPLDAGQRATAERSACLYPKTD